jgi:hypothetical protein
MLSLGVGALQLMLDRGGEVDWFSAVEIWIELGLALDRLLGVHRPHPDGEESLHRPEDLRRPQLRTGLVFIFVVGIILLASLALLPPMLSRILGYPVITTGLVMAPRGVGTMISMLLVGRLVRVVDPRMLVVTGLSLTALSLVRDDRLHAADGRLAHHPQWRGAGPRPRPGLRAAVDHRLRHAGARASAPMRPACSAWCATSARPSGSPSSRRH